MVIIMAAIEQKIKGKRIIKMFIIFTACYIFPIDIIIGKLIVHFMVKHVRHWGVYGVS